MTPGKQPTVERWRLSWSETRVLLDVSASYRFVTTWSAYPGLGVPLASTVPGVQPAAIGHWCMPLVRLAVHLDRIQWDRASEPLF